jgi:hypothetical protein
MERFSCYLMALSELLKLYSNKLRILGILKVVDR